MENYSVIKLFALWLKLRLRVIILFALCAASVFFVALLAHLPLEYVMYSLLLCLFFAVCFSVSDFTRTVKKHRQLYALYIDLENLGEQIEADDGIISEDYSEIVKKLSENAAKLTLELKQRETEAKDYYTLWTHQIKTPIAAMKLIIENGNAEPALLRSELFRIERYTEMALGYIRLESINEDMVLREYNIRDIAAVALKKYFVLFSLKKLSLDFPDFELIAVTDDKWTSFVIEQLLSNSIKYTSDGGISIYRDGNCLVISDTGIGISESDLPRIFERGFTGFNGRMDKKSTGLGLYLCHKILGVLGHKIKISSEQGKGTTVSIDFTQENNNVTKMKD